MSSANGVVASAIMVNFVVFREVSRIRAAVPGVEKN